VQVNFLEIDVGAGKNSKKFYRCAGQKNEKKWRCGQIFLKIDVGAGKKFKNYIGAGQKN